MSTADERLARAVARLDERINWERRDKDASMRRDLAAIDDLCARLGRPERSFRAVHVAGTKGKGTTSALVAAGLRRAGFRVGLYTSPHVEHVDERVMIDGAPVDHALFAEAIEGALDVSDDAKRSNAPAGNATWFDVMTAAAFSCFARSRLDWAVVECGLGGRLDSTNAVRGEVCVVTNVDLEHVKVLGDTRAKIAREKAGILKRGSTLVTGVERGSEAWKALEEVAASVGAPIRALESRASTMLERNADLARLVLDELGRRGVDAPSGARVAGTVLDDELVLRSRLPGRLERFVVNGTHVVVDAAHVPSSVRQLLVELRRDPALRGKAFCVLALGRDKDAEGILKELSASADRVFCTTVASGPLVDAETLVRDAARLGMAAEKADDPAQALARALRCAGTERWVLVVGSFYLAGAVRAQLVGEATPWPKATRC